MLDSHDDLEFHDDFPHYNFPLLPLTAAGRAEQYGRAITFCSSAIFLVIMIAGVVWGVITFLRPLVVRHAHMHSMDCGCKMDSQANLLLVGYPLKPEVEKPAPVRTFMRWATGRRRIRESIVV